ncbi:hypothetical protein AB0E08_08035 [Streptomyces sp. NPDC048281]|uniref:hypothetical protein n=1 Tax=Streptomyces sp. NPDC048281 TaxID=3154715 RepID=UPI0034307DDC
MSYEDFYLGIPSTVSERQGSLPAVMGLPAAWQATADNLVTRHYAPGAGASAVNAGDQVRIVDHKLQTLQKLMSTSRTEVDELENRLRVLVSDFRAPDSELATANQALLDLQKRNEKIIGECGRWKKRATDAEAALEEIQKNPETPNYVTFIRKGTPGDSVRYLAAEVMKHAEGNLDLAGLAVALRMTAADVDSLPQGTP